jgi:hypothetical protein
MSTVPINLPLYRVLVQAGASEAEAAEAARHEASELVTKADLQLALRTLKTDLRRAQVTLLTTLAAIYGGLILVLLLVRP